MQKNAKLSTEKLSQDENAKKYHLVKSRSASKTITSSKHIISIIQQNVFLKLKCSRKYFPAGSQLRDFRATYGSKIRQIINSHCLAKDLEFNNFQSHLTSNASKKNINHKTVTFCNTCVAQK